MSADLPDYLADNYGRCIAVTCQCRPPNPWLGRGCLHWMPSKARSFGELQNEQILFVREARA